MLEKTLESPLDCKEIQPVHSEGDQPWDFFGRNDAKAEAPVLWPLHVKSWLIGKESDAGRDWGQEEKGTTKDEMARWHHWHDGSDFEWTPGVGDGQGGLECCDSWGCKELDTTERLNWTETSQTPSSHNTREDSTPGVHQMVNTETGLIIFFAAKGGEALYSQQKQDRELTVAQIVISLLRSSDLNWRK